MSQDYRELAPLKCPVCRYDLFGFRVGDQCPECGSVISASRRSNFSSKLVRTSRYIVIPGVTLAGLSVLCITSSLWLLTIPVNMVVLFTGFIFAIFARANLIEEQCYDGHASDELRLAFWAFPVYFIIVLLFFLADVLIMTTNNLV